MDVIETVYHIDYDPFEKPDAKHLETKYVTILNTEKSCNTVNRPSNHCPHYKNDDYEKCKWFVPGSPKVI